MGNQNILSGTAWWILNKSITKELGIDASLLLTELISKHNYFSDRGMLDEEGFFFSNREELENSTTLSLFRQNKALEILKKLKIIQVTNKGMPPVTRFRISFLKIDELITFLSSNNY